MTRHRTRRRPAGDFETYAGGASEIKFDYFGQEPPDMTTLRPPRVDVAACGDHRLVRSTMGGAWYDVCPKHGYWYLGKFASERAAIVAWQTRLRSMGVV